MLRKPLVKVLLSAFSAVFYLITLAHPRTVSDGHRVLGPATARQPPRDRNTFQQYGHWKMKRKRCAFMKELKGKGEVTGRETEERVTPVHCTKTDEDNKSVTKR
jgi:hypothetical protein